MDEGGGRIMGFVVMIGIVLLLNVLSYFFGWGYYFY
ncbi:hypothetical protein Pla8534_05270 [Lignipirellula cremea]|uniref:Uncharacterized protein n=1 Tax=Lignipirellula cremea TaxID=2528010 RepID=A0A518DLR1_9BACT|nr:hypothetical protein Pla8534_05270 [Lignipirellula cremea]